MSADPYADLGVAKTASAEEIKKAYKRIARESHPDLNPGDTTAADRFKAAAGAYDLLKDPEQRARFDRGEIDATGQETPERRYYREYADSGGTSYHTGRGYEDFEDLGDVFSDLFGRQARRSGQGAGGGGRTFSVRGADDRYMLDVGFLEAAKGATRRITLPGGGTLDVKIPEGLADGQTIRLRGKGSPGLGDGGPGDALVTVSVGEHPLFRRDGADILLDLPISLDEAVLGGKVEAPTIDGKVALTIPKGASSGRVLRLRGRGVKRGSARGDQLVTLKIVAPKEVDAELEQFMQRWREDHRYNPREGMD